MKRAENQGVVFAYNRCGEAPGLYWAQDDTMGDLILEQRSKIFEVQDHYILQAPKGSLLEGWTDTNIYLVHNLDSITPVLSSYLDDPLRPITTNRTSLIYSSLICFLLIAHNRTVLLPW